MSKFQKGYPSKNKGKTYEEIYGKEKAEQLRKLRAEIFSKANKGRKLSEKHKKKLSENSGWKGKTRPEHAEFMRQMYLKGKWIPPAKNPKIAEIIGIKNKKPNPHLSEVIEKIREFLI